MPIIEMHMMQGRSDAQKRAVAGAVTEAVARSLGCSPETVRILITEHGTEEFFVAGLTMAERAERQRRTASQEQNP
ncbi:MULTISPECIES: tautomerase family protein [Thauera]|jgi:4-oxalocrotonate tautomerase|uniref:4-oxalocrotonate isomerase n=1 Tax=Thauera linaloolentis (strain DSM 12138 / JCM 21573 / CCUG 41526 / CIP 105981 / IAM 15112 / NBRC 102519 / 47Lol) TaxID=1123367 RepID=N6Y6Z0_THAL4|nr:MULTISPECIES: tautomerase family protein [Thauera]ENO89996.1 4-oxalocrotonate isomerase [Thauera linaloolentis 47Lol = DSM 12138]MCM8566576.1 tautomerase family protein [Thauera linaloolentis]